MVDINTFLLMIIYILCTVLITVFIILGIKLINVVNKVNNMVDDVAIKIDKFNFIFKITDIVTDNMSMISDKIVDFISSGIRKVFTKKRKDELENE